MRVPHGARVAALTVVACAFLPISQAAADEAVAEIDRSGPVAAYDGWTAWSRFADGRYTLMARSPQGAIAPVAGLSPSSRPWDVSIGPGASGDPALVFQRCFGAAGCQVARRYLEGPVARRRVQVISAVSSSTAAEATPAIWRSRVAFTRRLDGCDVPFVKDLNTSRPSERLRSTGCVQTRPGHLSLRGTRVIVSSKDAEGTSELRRFTAAGGLSTRLLGVEGGEVSDLLGQVAQDERFAYSVRFGEDGAQFLRVGTRGGPTTSVPAFAELTAAFAKAADHSSVFVQGACGDPLQRPCRVVSSPSQPFGLIVRTLVPELSAARDGSTVRGVLTRRQVAGDEPLRSNPVAGVEVELLRRSDTAPQTSTPTGLRATTDAQGAYVITVPAADAGTTFGAVAATSPIPTRSP